MRSSQRRRPAASLLLLVLCAATATALPAFWAAANALLDCTAHPSGPTPLGRHPATVFDPATTFALRDTANGAFVASVCAGGKYEVIVSFPEPRLALLTASAGSLARATGGGDAAAAALAIVAPSDLVCPGRLVAFPGEAPSQQLRALWQVPCEIATTAAGSRVSLAVTGGAAARGVLTQAAASVPANALESCPSALCGSGGGDEVTAAPPPSPAAGGDDNAESDYPPPPALPPPLPPPPPPSPSPTPAPLPSPSPPSPSPSPPSPSPSPPPQQPPSPSPATRPAPLPAPASSPSVSNASAAAAAAATAAAVQRAATGIGKAPTQRPRPPPQAPPIELIELGTVAAKGAPKATTATPNATLAAAPTEALIAGANASKTLPEAAAAAAAFVSAAAIAPASSAALRAHGALMIVAFMALLPAAMLINAVAPPREERNRAASSAATTSSGQQQPKGHVSAPLLSCNRAVARTASACLIAAAMLLAIVALAVAHGRGGSGSSNDDGGRQAAHVAIGAASFVALFALAAAEWLPRLKTFAQFAGCVQQSCAAAQPWLQAFAFVAGAASALLGAPLMQAQFGDSVAAWAAPVGVATGCWLLSFAGMAAFWRQVARTRAGYDS